MKVFRMLEVALKSRHVDEREECSSETGK